jgi:hypothetical protein
MDSPPSAASSYHTGKAGCFTGATALNNRSPFHQ